MPAETRARDRPTCPSLERCGRRARNASDTARPADNATTGHAASAGGSATASRRNVGRRRRDGRCNGRSRASAERRVRIDREHDSEHDGLGELAAVCAVRRKLASSPGNARRVAHSKLGTVMVLAPDDAALDRLLRGVRKRVSAEALLDAQSERSTVRTRSGAVAAYPRKAKRIRRIRARRAHGREARVQARPHSRTLSPPPPSGRTIAVVSVSRRCGTRFAARRRFARTRRAAPAPSSATERRRKPRFRARSANRSPT